MSDFQISIFENDNKPHARAQKLFADFAALDAYFTSLLPECEDLPKKELPLWCPTIFRDSHRKRANVDCVFALGFDVDEAPIPTRLGLENALSEYSAFVHSSSRATIERPRWRLLVALDRPVSAAEYDRLWRAFAAKLPFKVGQNSKDPSRGWYCPKAGPGGYYESFVTGGAVLDVDAWLAISPAPSTTTIHTPAEFTEPATSDRTTRIQKNRAAAALLLGRAWPENGRHDAQLALAGALKHSGIEQATALEFLCDVCREAGDEDRAKRENTIEGTWRRCENTTGWPALTEHVDSSVVQAAKALLDVHAGDMAQIGRELRAEGPKQAKRLSFDFGAWATEPPPVDFLVEGLIPRGAIAMFFGRADSLKTWLLFSLAVALANGKPWLGTYAAKASKVGIVDFETGKVNVGRRLYMLGAGANPNLGAMSFAKLKPNDPEFWTELAKEGFDVVIVDSLRKANPGANENDSAEAIVPLEHAAEFSEATGCAVVWIHHANKSSPDGWPDFRGSGAIEDQVDCSFAVRKLELSPERSRVELRCEKPGDMRKPEAFATEVEFDDVRRRATVRLAAADAGQGSATEDDMGEQEIRAGIRLALANGPIETKEKLKARVRGKRERVYAEIGALETVGEIKKIEGVGYVLDSLDARRDRVFEQVRAFEHWTSAAKLAKASFVSTRFVEGMIREGLICKQATGDVDHGFMVVPR